MKQKALFFFESILLGMILLFSACGAAQGGGQAVSAPGAPSLSAAQAAGEGDTIPDADTPKGEDLRLVTSDENFSSRKTTGNENGYYCVDRSDNINAVNANLRYIDYATAKDVYLSSDPSADHRAGGYQLFGEPFRRRHRLSGRGQALCAADRWSRCNLSDGSGRLRTPAALQRRGQRNAEYGGRL